MHTCIVLFTVLTFSSVAISAGLQEALNVTKCLTDTHRELTNSCVFFMNLEGEEQGENNFDFFPARMSCFGKMYCDFESYNAASLKK